MGYINAIETPDLTTHLIEPTLFISTSGTASAITATIANFVLAAGVSISLKISITNAANATLSINNEEGKAIYYKNMAIEAGTLKANYIYNLVYDGTVWHVVGEKLTDNEMVLPHKLTFGADGVYEYDGSADVTVPVYSGTIL